MDDDQRHALSFGPVAALYDGIRPSYPAAAVDWVLAAASPPPRRVLDLGAGTGKLTRLLLDAGLEVVAVDPSEQMLAQLSALSPGVEVHAAPAEALPLPDASVDAVTCAQAWHWVDPAPAAAEVGRVLRPGGVLGLLWNLRDEREPWVEAFGAAMETGPEHLAELDADGRPLGLTALGGVVEETVVEHTVIMAASGLRQLAASRSHLLTREPDDRVRILDAVDALVRTHPALAGRDRIAVPYRTRVWRVVKPT